MPIDLETMVRNAENNKPRRLILAALPYINNVPHLGHIVGEHYLYRVMQIYLQGTVD